MNDLGLDSLDQVEIIMAVEDEFSKYISISVQFFGWNFPVLSVTDKEEVWLNSNMGNIKIQPLWPCGEICLF